MPDQPEPARAATPDPWPTFALAARIAADEGLPAWRRRSAPTYVRCLCRCLALDPATTPADLRPLRDRLARFRPRRAGVDRRHWQNIVGGVRWALRYAGVECMPQRNLTPPSPAWAALLARIPEPGPRARLGRFARWCTERGVAPTDADRAAVEAFRAALETSGVGGGRAVRAYRGVVGAWNEAAEVVPGWPPVRLALGPHPLRRTPTFDAFPGSLGAEIEAHLAWTGRDDPLGDDAPARPLKPATVEGRRYGLRAYLGALLAAGYAPENLRSLADLVEVEAVKAGLRCLLQRSPDGNRLRTYKVACAPRTIARDRVGVGDAELARISHRVEGNQGLRW